ncbi:VOC family protein, partial [Nocardioides kribbensis]|uniref:VOC family protein n=1 Tax=Nocardioides kribbensis TaxID=305517 RepID=UPI0032DBA14D
MDQRLSFVTLAARDLAASRRFYLDGLGWRAALDVEGEVLMVKVADRVVLSLWDRRAFEAEVGPLADGPGLAPLTLAHNVATREEVDAVLATARGAGADPVNPGQERAWGGYTGYFADP